MKVSWRDFEVWPTLWMLRGQSRQTFYRSLNSILRIEGRSDDMILLRLIEAHCIPILTYGIEITHIANRDEAHSLRVAYNAIFRRIFSYRLFESVSNLQRSLGRKTWESRRTDHRSQIA